MTDKRAPKLELETAFTDASRDPDLSALCAYWELLRHGRLMPSRADFDPAAVPKLLRHIILYNVDGPGRYTVRLLGETVQSYVGQNTTGKPAGSIMSEFSAARLIEALDAVVAERTPKFRAGTVHWREDKIPRQFEVCFLPLSPDNGAVNMILTAIKFLP